MTTAPPPPPSTSGEVIRELTDSSRQVTAVRARTAPTVFAMATAQELQSELGRLERRLYTIDDKLLDETTPGNGDTVRSELMEAKKAKLKILIRLNALRYESNHLAQKEYEKLQEKLQHIDRLLAIFEEYSSSFTQKQIKRGIDVLTLVTVVFLPLTCFISFFGMNFASMGSVAAPGTTVFTRARAHWVVLAAALVYAIAVFGIMRWLARDEPA